MPDTTISVVKRDGSRVPYDAEEIHRSIEDASRGLDDHVARVTQLASELEITLFDGITTAQLDEAVVQIALQNVAHDPAFDVVAARLACKAVYKQVLGWAPVGAELRALHRERFPGSIRAAAADGLLAAELTERFDLDALAAALDPTVTSCCATSAWRPCGTGTCSATARASRPRRRSSSGCGWRWGWRSTRPTRPRQPRRSTTKCRSWTTWRPGRRWSTRARGSRSCRTASSWRRRTTSSTSPRPSAT